MTLDESIQKAVELLLEKQKTPEEIAQITGLTVGAVQDLAVQVLSDNAD